MGKKEKSPLRTVIDTNVFISALLFDGVASQLVDYWQKGKFVYLISPPIIKEYITVLSYPKFHLTEKEIKEAIEDELIPFIQVVRNKTNLSLIKDDPSDNIFLSTAIDGQASFVVSGDRHLLNIKQYRNIFIITVKDFLELLLK